MALDDFAVDTSELTRLATMSAAGRGRVHDLSGPGPDEDFVGERRAVTNTPKTDLNPPLHEIVDPDALDTLCQPLNGDILRDGSGQLTLPLHGCTVTLDWSGTIRIEPPEES